MRGKRPPQPEFTCSKLTIETLEQVAKYVQIGNWRRSGVFIINFEHISHLFLVSIVNFEHEITDWDCEIHNWQSRDFSLWQIFACP